MELAVIAEFCLDIRPAHIGLLRGRRLGHGQSRVVASEPRSVVGYPGACLRSLQILSMRAPKGQYERQADRSG
jgi:hypothetical protein